MHSLLKNAREAKGLKTREVAATLDIDQALICKFENGKRTPTREQVIRLATFLEIDLKTLLTLWIKGKILNAVENEEFGIDALKAALAEKEPQIDTPFAPNPIDALFEEMNALKDKLEGLRNSQNKSS